MPAYVIATVNVTDMDRYREYLKLTPATIDEHGGRFLARGGETVTLEGPEETRRVVVLEFADMASARAWYASEGYRRAKALREGAAEASFVLVDGV